MKQLLCIFFSALLCLTLCACDSTPAPVEIPDPVPETEVQNPQTNSPIEEAPIPDVPADVPEVIPDHTTEDVTEIAQIVFTRCEAATDGVFTEYAEINGIGSDGEILWNYTTDHFEAAQMYQTSEIGRGPDRYYFCESGTVVALDPQTGEVLWKNSEFNGAPAQDRSCLIDDDGTVYLCGYLGPDFFAVDADGNTLCKTSTFSEDYWWPYALEKQGEQMAITFEMGPDGAGVEGGYVLYVDLNEFTWSTEQ